MSRDSIWDNEDKAMAEFPADKYERIPVSSEPEARGLIAVRSFYSHDPEFGEARWFGPERGMLFILKKQADPPIEPDAVKIHPEPNTDYSLRERRNANIYAWTLIVCAIGVMTYMFLYVLNNLIR